MKSVKLSILFFVVCFTSAYARFAGGNGTETDPYQIETAEQLGYLKEFLADKSAKGEYFILTQDIDLSTYLSPGNPGYNNGAGWEPISSLIPFEGTINGNGKVIKNLWCNRPGESYVGFMSQLGRYGKIDRLGVEIDENKAIKGESVGALVGYSSGFINECYTKGSITSAETSDMNCYVGGIAGIGNGSILNSYSVCDISIPIPGYPRVGGLVGIGAYIYKCYFGGKINAPRGDVGGLVGCIVSCDIIECASSGEWIRSDIHPIYGINMARGNSKQEIRDNYLGVSYIQSTYESLNWDFQKVWTMPSAEGLPILAWQVKTTPQPVKFAGGTGMETDPYLIANAGELTLLNNYLGNKGLGKYFRLTQDIDLTAYLTGKADGWLPVGNDVNKFNGKFDGNQKNITGLYINRKDHEKYEEDDCIGLFGALGADGEVKNVCVNVDIHYTGVKINDRNMNNEDYHYVGAIVGRNYGTVSICCSSGTLTAEGVKINAGGLVGQNNGKVINCYSSCDLTSIEGYSVSVGGLVGFQDYSKGTENCYASGNIMATGEGSYGGGLVAFNARGSIIGSVAANTIVEGTSSDIHHSPYIHRLVGYNDNPTGLILNNYAFGGALVNGVTVTGNITNREGKDKTIAELYDQATYTANNWDFNTVWKMSFSLPVFIWQSGITAPVINGTDAVPVASNPYENFCGGNGTIENPFQICNAHQLANLNNYPGDLGKDKYFILMNDIDLTDYINANNADGKGWLPIGNESFNGFLDGNDQTITGLWFNRPDEDYSGLFAFLGSGGEIKDLSVETSSRENKGKKYVGILTGKSNGKIVNCNTGGIVSGYSASSDFLDAFIGGIAGYTSGTGSIEKCNSVCKVSATGYSAAVGGIVGFSNYTIIDACNFAGEVIASGKGSYAGGIAGFARKYNTVRNCLSTAFSVNGGNPKNVHRIAGYNDFANAKLENNTALASILVNGTEVTSNIGSGTVEGLTTTNIPLRASYNMSSYVQRIAYQVTGTKQSQTSELIAYPNPATDILTIKGTQETPNGIRLFDVAGKQIKIYNAANGSTDIDVSGLEKGIYFLNLNGTTMKIVKK